MNFGADVFDEGDAYALSVDVFVKIENMWLEKRLGAADRGTGAEIGDRTMPGDIILRFDADPDRVNAEGRFQVIGKQNVGRPESDCSADLVAMGNPACDFEGSAE